MWNSIDKLMAHALPNNPVAQILIPWAVAVPILILLGAYSTATFRGVASLPKEHFTLFLVEYEHPLVVFMDFMFRVDEAWQNFRKKNRI